MEEDSSSVRKNPILRLYETLAKVTKFITVAVTQMMKGMIDMLNSLYRKLLSTILRSSLAIILVINLFMTNAIPNFI